VAFSPDGQRLFSKDQSGKMLVWNPRTGERLADDKPPAVTFLAGRRTCRVSL
jgi:hypothetical protein